MKMNNYRIIYTFPPNVRKAWDEVGDNYSDDYYNRVKDNIDEYGDLFEDFIDEI